MGSKNFRLNIIFRIIILTIALFGFVFVCFFKSYYVIPLLIGCFILFVVINLINYVEKTNRDLSSFLQSIRYSDFTRSFKLEGLGESFDELQKSFDQVIADFQKIRAEKEEHYYYIQNIIQHVGIGILAYQKNGTVEMINNAAKKLFQIFNLKKIQELGQWNQEVEKTLFNIKSGENALVKVQEDDDYLQLSIYATEFKLNNRLIILVTINNIQTELEEKEMESWQKLIRVLTHEIMNSIAPIASLTSTVNLMINQLAETLEKSKPDNFDLETISDIQNALVTIQKRSSGLIHFVETYRNLTKIPKPNFTIFPVKQLFDNVHNLLREDLLKAGIECNCTVEPENLEITGDEQLLEQVLINHVKNSVQALENIENGKIDVKAFHNKRGRPTLQVIDNGQGILNDVLDRIFVPFFTTKPKGSGIGLSLSKQIIRLHGGSITVKSEPYQETSFTITF